MLTTARWLFTVEDFKRLGQHEQAFGDASLSHFAGRCLLDVLEYLRADLGQTEKFQAVRTAHALRLSIQCLNQTDEGGRLSRFSRHIETNYRRLRSNRNREAPFYGEDFWDWAYVLDAFLVVRDAIPSLSQEVEDTLTIERDEFVRAVDAKTGMALSLGRPDEWFGPAVPAAVYRVLDRLALAGERPELRETLREQALRPIDADGTYMGKAVAPGYYHWHYGQVLAMFPNEARALAVTVADLGPLNHLGRADQAYALSRVIQGLSQSNQAPEWNTAVGLLMGIENQSRAFGTGLVGENVKGSVNALEAIWPLVSAEQKAQTVSRMVDSLLILQKRQNMVGVLVALDTEEVAVLDAFRNIGAQTEAGQGEGVTLVEHTAFCAVVAKGKALLDSGDVVRRLINDYHISWLIIAGIAGSLGIRSCRFIPYLSRFCGPKKGDVVLATSVAPYEIRTKVRNETRSVAVPFRDCDWEEIPVHPLLYTLAYREAKASEDIAARFHAGLVATRSGILDNRKAKLRLLARWPAGIAVEEEGYVACLVAQLERVPAVVIRGISDLAQGDKRKQDKASREKEQKEAAQIAAGLAVRTIAALSKEW